MKVEEARLLQEDDLVRDYQGTLWRVKLRVNTQVQLERTRTFSVEERGTVAGMDLVGRCAVRIMEQLSPTPTDKGGE